MDDGDNATKTVSKIIPATVGTGTPTQRWLWLLVLFFAPIVVLVVARWMLNEIIETQLISFDFFVGFSGNLDVLGGVIPTAVILGLYHFGLALCATFVLAIFLVTFASYLVLNKQSLGWTVRLQYLSILASILCVAVLRFSGFEVTNIHLPTEIARKLVDGTLGRLPQCGDPKTACRFLNYAIGNTGSSLKDVVIPIYYIVALAGLSYISAVASIAWGDEDADMKKNNLENVTILAALVFLLTVVSVYLLFRPGAEMIAAAYGPLAKDAKPPATLQAYNQLSDAMTFYWATIFSLALCSSYFPASLYLNSAYGVQISFKGVWSFAKTAITMLAPYPSEQGRRILGAARGNVG